MRGPVARRTQRIGPASRNLGTARSGPSYVRIPQGPNFIFSPKLTARGCGCFMRLSW